MKNPKVSIIVTTYNRKHYLKDTLDSVFNQTFNDFELIIIDDGSTDETKELIKLYKCQRIKYFYQNNSGLNAARNAGINLACGEFLAFLDSDDIWLPTKLEKQVNILEKYPDICLVYCGTLLINEENKIIGQKPLVQYGGYVLNKLIFTNFLYNGSCVLFRSSCLDKVGLFDISIKRMTDWEFYLRFALYYRFYGINEYLLKYRIHRQTMSSDFKSYENSGFKILDKIFNHKDLDSKYLTYKNKALAMRYRYIGRRYFENGYAQEARIYLKEALKLDLSLLYQSDVSILYTLSYFSGYFINCIKSLKKCLIPLYSNNINTLISLFKGTWL
ncbi:MAG: glycosyltransferase [bacterium]